MARESQENPLMLRNVFQEDVVCHQKKPDVIGIVLQNALDSQESDLDSEDEEERIASGHVLVAWYPKGLEEEVEEKKLELVDRSLLPGDVVRWADTNKGVQKGYIREVVVKINVKIVGTNHILESVDCRQMKPLQDFVPGIVVADGPWLGIIMEVFVKLVLRLKNGARCVIEGEQVNMLADNTDQRDEESPFYCPGFYPGQHVAGSSRVFREVQWITGPRPVMSNSQRIKAVVEEVVTTGLNVNWQVCGYTGSSEASSTSPPDAVVSQETLPRLIALNHFKEASIQIGDKAYFILKDDDMNNHLVVKTTTQSIAGGGSVSPSGKESMEAVKSRAGVKHRKAPLKDPKERDETGDTKDDRVIKGDRTDKQDKDEKDDEGQDSSSTEDSADDEDSDRENDRDARQSSHSTPGSRRSDGRHQSAGATARGHVTRRRRHIHRRKKKHHVPVNLAPGGKVCVEVATTKTVASVVWQDGSFEEHIPSTELLPVLHLDELEFFPGDFVVDKQAQASSKFGVVQTSNNQQRTCRVQWLNNLDSDSNIDNDVSVYDLADHPDYNFRPGDVIVRLEGHKNEPNDENEPKQTFAPCGQVAYVGSNGEVSVVWTDGRVLSVPPDKLYVVHREDDDMSESSSGSDTDWETASDLSSEREDDHSHQINVIEDVIMRSLAALGTGSGSNVPEGHTENRDEMDHDPIIDTHDTSQDVTTEDCSGGATNDGVDDAASCEFGQETSAVERFSMVEEVPQSHRFFSSTFQPHNQRQFTMHIQKELALLRSSLPEGILVRGYENRMDLYSILIYGPPGTPYEDGLFVFDLQLPPDYPKSPPNLHYVSYCSGRLNPNLYEDGKVCVSLLGTWTGRGTETWTSKSNLCQVMLSLQGLILCEEPYYNEAGYEKHKGSAEGHENSRMYNEMVLIKLLQSMQRMIENPPEAFKEEVLKHFQDRLLRLISRMEAWLQRQLPQGSSREDFSVTQCDTSGIPDPEFPLYPLSYGFCKTLLRAVQSLAKLVIAKGESSCL